MTHKWMSDLCHELFAIVSGSVGVGGSIEETVDIMIDAIKEDLKTLSFLEIIKLFIYSLKHKVLNKIGG